MADEVDAEPEVLVDCPVPHVLVASLNRPAARNAVNGVLARRLEATVQRVESDDDIRVAILASSTAGMFCAGADLKAVSAGRCDMVTVAGGFGGFVDHKRSKPWIAAVSGHAFGGGCELALACEMIVAADDAQFALPEVRRGLIATGGGLYRLPRAIPRNIALELIASGAPISAARAATVGLVNHITTRTGLLERAVVLAASIAGNAPCAVRESLALARASFSLPEAMLTQATVEAAGRLAGTEDFLEGPRAFVEKRTPRWTGR